MTNRTAQTRIPDQAMPNGADEGMPVLSPAIVLTRVEVGIRGLHPGLLMACKDIMEKESGKEGVRLKPEEEARLHAHWMTVGKQRLLCLPWVNLYKCLCAAAADFKWKGAKNFASIVAGTISCPEDRISLGTAEYEVYREWVRIPPKVGAMVKIGRPRLRDWSCSFAVDVDGEMWGRHGVVHLKDILVHAGRMIGLGPWRPSLKGPYGKFTLEKFEIQK